MRCPQPRRRRRQPGPSAEASRRSTGLQDSRVAEAHSARVAHRKASQPRREVAIPVLRHVHVRDPQQLFGTDSRQGSGLVRNFLPWPSKRPAGGNLPVDRALAVRRRARFRRRSRTGPAGKLGGVAHSGPSTGTAPARGPVGPQRSTVSTRAVPKATPEDYRRAGASLLGHRPTLPGARPKAADRGQEIRRKDIPLICRTWDRVVIGERHATLALKQPPSSGGRSVMTTVL